MRIALSAPMRKMMRACDLDNHWEYQKTPGNEGHSQSFVLAVQKGIELVDNAQQLVRQVAAAFLLQIFGDAIETFCNGSCDAA